MHLVVVLLLVSACAHQPAPGCPAWARLGERSYVEGDALFAVGSAAGMREELAQPAADNRARAELARGVAEVNAYAPDGPVFAAETLVGAEVVERCVDARGAVHSLLRLTPPPEPPETQEAPSPPPPELTPTQ